MGNVLSQEEIDSLLDGIGDGKVDTETDAPQPEQNVVLFDFREQTGPIHQRLPGLANICERLVGLLRSSLALATRVGIDVNFSTTESVKFAEFWRAVPLPASLNICKLEPLRGYVLLVLEGPLVFSFVDIFFGGKGMGHVKLEGRGFTAIETKIIQKVIQIILGDLEKAWAETYPVKAVLSRTEMDPQFASIVRPDEIVIASKFIVDLENTSGALTICLPHSAIEPVRDKLKNRFQSDRMEVDYTWRNYIQNKIKNIPVELTCTLGSTQISGRELLALKADDIILLDQKAGHPVRISIAGVPKFSALPGACKSHKAVQIVNVVNKKE